MRIGLMTSRGCPPTHNSGRHASHGKDHGREELGSKQNTKQEQGSYTKSRNGPVKHDTKVPVSSLGSRSLEDTSSDGWLGVVCDINPQGIRVELTVASEGSSDDDEDDEEGAGCSRSAAGTSHLRRGMGYLR